MTDKKPQSPETIAVLETQQSITKAHSAIEKLESAISECEAQISKQQAGLLDVEKLVNQRCDFLADMAIGQNRNKEIKKLDAEIAELSAQRNSAVPDLAQTVEGLKRRISTWREELVQLNKRKEQLIRQLLLSMAQTVGVEYFEAATALTDRYKRLVALNDLLRVDGSIGPLLAGRDGLYIPRFNLESMPDRGPSWESAALFTTIHKTQLDQQNWARQVKACLAEIGIELP